MDLVTCPDRRGRKPIFYGLLEAVKQREIPCLTGLPAAGRVGENRFPTMISENQKLAVSDQALADFLAGSAEGPFVLVNLIRFREGGGRAAYDRYSLAVAPLLRRYGAEPIFYGESLGTLIGQDAWDMALVTRYPSRTALAGLLGDPAFLAAGPLREAALSEGVLYAFG